MMTMIMTTFQQKAQNYSRYVQKGYASVCDYTEHISDSD